MISGERSIGILVGEHYWGRTQDPSLIYLRDLVEELGVEFVNVSGLPRARRYPEIIDRERFELAEFAMGEVTAAGNRIPIFFGYLASRKLPHLLLAQRTSDEVVAEWAKISGLNITSYDERNSLPDFVEHFLSEMDIPWEVDTRFKRRGILEVGDLHMDDVTFTLTLGGEEVDVTPTEYWLLHFLIENKGKVMYTEEILSNVWGEGYDDDRHVLRVHLSRLRGKLGDVGPDRERHIIGKPGFGYRIVDGSITETA